MATLKYLALCCLITITSCQQNAYNMLPTLMPIQAFLPSVSPMPNERISYEEYKAKLEPNELGIKEFGPICVKYDALQALEAGDDGFQMEDFLSRSLLLVNGEVWPNSQTPDFYLDYLGFVKFNSSAKGNAVGPYHFCWDIELEPGMHTIEFKTKKTSGEELAYRWSFFITE
jgi:hypothetical protein